MNSRTQYLITFLKELSSAREQGLEPRLSGSKPLVLPIRRLSYFKFSNYSYTRLYATFILNISSYITFTITSRLPLLTAE